MDHYELHRRQFLISRSEAPSGWHSVPLKDGWFLFHHPEALVEKRDNYYTIGTRLPGEGGRFAHLEWPYLTVDVGGLMGVFYDQKHECASSSLALLSKNHTGVSVAPLPRNLINWFPDGPLPGVKRLLRDQRLHLPTMSPEWFDRKITPLGSDLEARKALAEALTESTLAIPSDKRLFLALTGGKDSRTLAATLLAADIRFETYTQVYPGIARSDVKIAKAISKHIGVRHHLITPDGYNQDILKAWENHTCRAVHDADNTFFPSGQYNFALSDVVLVRGGCFEVGRRFYSERLNSLDFTNVTGQDIVDRFQSASDKVAGLDEWLEWRRKHDCGLDLIDSFYLDQRMGGWVSAIEQGLDMLPSISLHPVNNLNSYRALMTPAIDDRTSEKLQIETIRELAPNLLRWEFNPKSIYSKWLRPYLHRTPLFWRLAK